MTEASFDLPVPISHERTGVVSNIHLSQEMRAGNLQAFWGKENVSFQTDSEVGEVASVFLEGGKVHGVNDGLFRRTAGAGFRLPREKADHAVLSYHVRFPKEFPFVKGGKLPGLYGGAAPTGGRPVEASEGFTTRFMWRQDGKGEVYGYIPDQKDSETVEENGNWGKSIGAGTWSFEADGLWHNIRQEIALNEVGKNNGLVRVYYDGGLAYENGNLVIRNSTGIRIDGLIFSVFHGGNNLSWAPGADTSIDFAKFQLDTN